MRWPWVALNSVFAPFTAQKFLVFTKLSSRNQAQCIVVHGEFECKGFFLPVVCLDAELPMQTNLKTLKKAVNIFSRFFLGFQCHL